MAKTIAVTAITIPLLNRPSRAKASELSRVARTDQCRSEFGTINRGIGFQLPVAQVIGGGDNSGLSALGGAKTRGRHRLHQRRATQPDRSVHDIRRRTGVDGLAPVFLRVFEEKPRIGTHQVIGARQIRFGRGAHARGLPVLVGGHDLVDLRDRHRQGHEPVDFAVHADRRDHPRRGLVEVWLIRLKVGDPGEVDVVGGQSFLVCVAQI